MTEDERTRREDYPFPSAVRQNTAVKIYANPQEVLAPHIKFDLSQGVQPFGPPPFLKEVLKEMRKDDRDIDAISGYGRVDLSGALEFQYEWHGVTPATSHISFVNQGSYGALMDIFFNLAKSPSQGNVRVIGSLDFPAAYKATQRYDVDAPEDSESPKLPKKMPFYRVPMSINSSQDDILDSALELVDNFGKSGRDGFIVANTIPSSPKGATPLDSFKTLRLARRAAKYGYLFVHDQVFKGVRTPSESFAYLTAELPNTMVVDSGSKIAGMPGARLGTVIMSNELKDSFEGMRTEYEFDGLMALFAQRFYNPGRLVQHRDFINEIVERTEEIKEPLVEGLRDEGIKVFDTDNKVPIFFVRGVSDDFCDLLYDQGIKVAPGSGFNSTFAGITTDRRSYNRELITNKYARVTIPPRLEDVPELIEKFVRAT